MARRDLREGHRRLAAVLGPPAGGTTWAAAAPPEDDIAGLPAPPGVPENAGTEDDVAGHPTVPGPMTAGRWERLAERWLPAAWRGARLDPGRPGALALLLTAAVAAVLAAVGVWWEAPRAERVPDLPALVDPTSSVAAPTGATPRPGPPEPLVVAVVGKVARPGLVRVAAGARVADVLAAAGGALPGVDLAGVNLARKVGDGEQVAVGVAGAPGPAPAAGVADAPGGPGAAAPGAPLDLNAATVEQLDVLPGVGPVMAGRIVAWRTHNGRFATVDQLREVAGIGERRLAQLRELVRV